MLHAAVIKAQSDMVEELVFHGSNVNAVDYNGDTPLHLNFSVMKALQARCGTSPIMLEVHCADGLLLE